LNICYVKIGGVSNNFVDGFRDWWSFYFAYDAYVNV